MEEHFCTYFDRGFLPQGLALASSLILRSPGSVLWVLCLDDFTAQYLERSAPRNVRPFRLEVLEEYDPELAEKRVSRTRIEYYFTLSPCWPRFLLNTHPEIQRLTYVDADLYFFSSPAPIFAEMADSSLYVTAHRYPAFLAHHHRFGYFNVGVVSFRNNACGAACLDRWRRQCLDWCRDCCEDGKYADQKYLDEWPGLYGSDLCVARHRGVNLAPWNWSSCKIEWRDGEPLFDGERLVVFHFARFRPLRREWLFQSGQLEYGVMARRLREYVYSPYGTALLNARDDVRTSFPDFDFPPQTGRDWHRFHRVFLPRLIFGSDWVRVGTRFYSGRFGFGRFSGKLMSRVRSFFGKNRVSEGFSPNSSVSANPFLTLPLSPADVRKESSVR